MTVFYVSNFVFYEIRIIINIQKIHCIQIEITCLNFSGTLNFHICRGMVFRFFSPENNSIHSVYSCVHNDVSSSNQMILFRNILTSTREQPFVHLNMNLYMYFTNLSFGPLNENDKR